MTTEQMAESGCLEFSHGADGRTVVFADGRVVVFDRSRGRYGLASGEPPVLLPDDEEQRHVLLGHLLPEQQQAVLSFLANPDEIRSEV